MNTFHDDLNLDAAALQRFDQEAVSGDASQASAASCFAGFILAEVNDN